MSMRIHVPCTHYIVVNIFSTHTEPTTAWQHCLDDGTQYYYYWNVTTNQVTWEIPDGYSQYLLLFKEYETQLSKYESELKLWEENQKNKPKVKKRFVYFYA